MIDYISEHKKTVEEAKERINIYKVNESCEFCKSTDLSHPLDGFIICENCGSHTFYGERFPYLEISREFLEIVGKRKITIKEVVNSFYENKKNYTFENRVEGKGYYWKKLLVDEFKEKTSEERIMYDNFNFKGRIEKYARDEYGEFTIKIGETSNLFLDDGKEATLDALFGYRGGRARAAWWDNENRYIGYGTCMFSNDSFERASGMDAIPTGQECSYPVASTMLVNPEDSFLSREVGQRTGITPTRRDQTTELSAIINVPGDIPIGTKVREWALFFKQSGPANDPSYFNESKPYSIICRATEKGTGYYTTYGGSCVACGSGASGAVLCYYDDPWTATGDIQLRWKFGEV